MKFIIWAPTWDETRGGAIVLHLLCERLNAAGHEALLWPGNRAHLGLDSSPGRIWWRLRYEMGREERDYSTGPFRSRLARARDIKDSVVIYPEIVEGNPLKSDRVVRWFLHQPGYFTGIAEYGPGELYFYYQHAFNDWSLNPHPENRLTITWINDVYKETGNRERSGSCYLLRKGKGRDLVHDLTDSTCVDDMSHEEKAAEFNRRVFFYSYDSYTLYTCYAALCGCIPVVIPEPGVSVEQWCPKEEDHYGIAYGFEQIDWAVATRPSMIDWLESRRRTEDAMVDAFVEKCQRKFFAPNRP